jgi:TPR repeat protein
MLNRAEANDPVSICVLAGYYKLGLGGLQQDPVKAIELLNRAAELGFSKAHSSLAEAYRQRGEI